MIARFLIDRNSLAPDAGFLDVGDTDFDYTLTIINVFTGEESQITGSIDLSDEITAETSSFVMPLDGSANVPITSESGCKMLWLYQKIVSCEN